MARSMKLVAEGGTRTHVGTCRCGARVIFHRTVTLDAEPVEGGRWVLFCGFALLDPDPGNLPAGEPLYRAHVCAARAPGDPGPDMPEGWAE